MGAPEDEHIFGVQLRESANDGSDFPNADADYRKLFLGEDGSLHLKDSAGTVTDIGGGTVANLDDIGDVDAPTPSDGDVLTFDSGSGDWINAAPGSASGGLVLLEQHTASSSATLDFTTFISSTYDEYLFEFNQIVPATDNVNFLGRVGTGGGPTYDAGSNYKWGGFRWAHNGTAATGQLTGTEFVFDVSGGIDNSANSNFCGWLRCFSPSSTAGHRRFTGQFGYVDNAGAPLGAVFDGGYITTTAITAMRFLMSSGNIASGTIRVYGIVK